MNHTVKIIIIIKHTRKEITEKITKNTALSRSPPPASLSPCLIHVWLVTRRPREKGPVLLAIRCSRSSANTASLRQSGLICVTILLFTGSVRRGYSRGSRFKGDSTSGSFPGPPLKFAADLSRRSRVVARPTAATGSRD